MVLPRLYLVIFYCLCLLKTCINKIITEIEILYWHIIGVLWMLQSSCSVLRLSLFDPWVETRVDIRMQWKWPHVSFSKPGFYQKNVKSSPLQLRQVKLQRTIFYAFRQTVFMGIPNFIIQLVSVKNASHLFLHFHLVPHAL